MTDAPPPVGDPVKTGLWPILGSAPKFGKHRIHRRTQPEIWPTNIQVGTRDTDRQGAVWPRVFRLQRLIQRSPVSHCSSEAAVCLFNRFPLSYFTPAWPPFVHVENRHAAAALGPQGVHTEWQQLCSMSNNATDAEHIFRNSVSNDTNSKCATYFLLLIFCCDGWKVIRVEELHLTEFTGSVSERYEPLIHEFEG